jgi:hypothetical protein
MNRRRVISSLVSCVAVGGVVTVSPTVGQAFPAGQIVRHVAESPAQRDLRVIDRWADRTGSRTYAGTYAVRRRGGIVLVVGFTRRQRLQLLLVRHLPGVVEPPRLAARRRAPKYSLVALRRVEAKIENARADNAQLHREISGSHIDVKRNKVVVETERTKAVKVILGRVLTPDAPVYVEWSEEEKLS